MSAHGVREVEARRWHRNGKGGPNKVTDCAGVEYCPSVLLSIRLARAISTPCDVADRAMHLCGFFKRAGPPGIPPALPHIPQVVVEVAEEIVCVNTL